MASLLEGPLARTVARAFRGKLTDGVLRREVPGTGNDDFGDPNAGTTPTFTFNGIRETFDAAFRVRAGIPQTDVGVLVLLQSVEPRTVPQQGDQIYIKAQWHKVREILDQDPASATMRLQCFEISAPV
ncbi:hypothetical protein C8D77_11181 [Mesorhizobium loti]|uniref:Uncharacterized protein n=1 Tax=Rhizobium loti TaxID=381 RepID=A0A8E3B2W2_RHILI|nr:hypothetical protein [Mesorhizobium loti]PWJ88359.1 hypothetical protein C8D77_11181 [Mesorhizobium loti]